MEDGIISKHWVLDRIFMFTGSVLFQCQLLENEQEKGCLLALLVGCPKNAGLDALLWSGSALPRFLFPYEKGFLEHWFSQRLLSCFVIRVWLFAGGLSQDSDQVLAARSCYGYGYKYDRYWRAVYFVVSCGSFLMLWPLANAIHYTYLKKFHLLWLCDVKELLSCRKGGRQSLLTACICFAPTQGNVVCYKIMIT